MKEAPLNFRKDGTFDMHLVGNPECDACWQRPTLCRCGGLIHSEYSDESYDSETGDESIFLEYCCDKCGSSDIP